MKVRIHGDKVKITPSIKDFVEEKISKLDKYFDAPEEIEAKVMIRIKNNEQTIEATVPVQKFTLRAEETHTDLYAAIDLVVDKLEGQFRKHKTRLNDRYKKEPKIIDFIFDNDCKTLANPCFFLLRAMATSISISVLIFASDMIFDNFSFSLITLTTKSIRSFGVKSTSYGF